jgi:hypothetical protein
MEEKIVGLVGWVLGLAALAFIATLPWCISTYYVSSEITVFPVISTPNGGEALDRMVFTVFPERQEVVCTILGVESHLIRLGKCVVRDKNNWTCSDMFSDRSMTDGNYRQFPVSSSVTYSNGWRWWFTKLTSFRFPSAAK